MPKSLYCRAFSLRVLAAASQKDLLESVYTLPSMVHMSVTVPKEYQKVLWALVRNKRYPTISEAVRTALRDFFHKEMWQTTLEHEALRKRVLELFKNDSQIKAIIEDLVKEVCG